MVTSIYSIPLRHESNLLQTKRIAEHHQIEKLQNAKIEIRVTEENRNRTLGLIT